MIVLFICVINLYFIGLYNSTQLKGNELMLGACFGISEFLGTLFGGKVVQYVSQHHGMFISLFMILVLSTSLKIDGVSETFIYIILLAQIFFIGTGFNIMLLLQES